LKIEDCRKLCDDETIVMTQHLVNRCREREISYDDIKYSISNGEIIENYPNAYPYPACLVFGMSINDKPIHVAVGVGDGKLWVITAYCPNLKEWESDLKTRKAENK